MIDDQSEGLEEALRLVSRYVDCFASGDSASMNLLRGSDFVLDFVYADAFESQPLSTQETAVFWQSWFEGFPEFDYEITRTIAGERVVVTEWVFTGTHSRKIGPPVFTPGIEPTERTIQIRGVSIYDVNHGKVIRETTYMDLATLMVELGITP